MVDKSPHAIHLHDPSGKERRYALDVFNQLLQSNVDEREWQSFFDTYPYVFSDTLGVKFDGIYRQVPLVSGKPDYVFRRNTNNAVGQEFGVIELKRPDQAIVGVYSSRLIYPTKQLRIAQQETNQHLNAIQRGQFLNSDDFFLAGNRRHAFIIMGLTSAATKKCVSEIYRSQFQDLLPIGFHIYTYDEILDLFTSTVQPVMHVLFVSEAIREESCFSEEFIVTWSPGLHLKPCVILSRTAQYFFSDITVKKRNNVANASDLMGLLTLAAEFNSSVTIEAIGSDARLAVETLGSVIRQNFFLEENTDTSLRTFLDEQSERYFSERFGSPDLRHKSIQEAAYSLAEQDSFRETPEWYWCRAESVVSVPNDNDRFSDMFRSANRHRRIQELAYELAEKDNFVQAPDEYWCQAQRLVR